MLYICETNFDYSIKDVVWIFNTTYQDMVVFDIKHMNHIFYVWVNRPIDYIRFKDNKIVIIQEEKRSCKVFLQRSIPRISWA